MTDLNENLDGRKMIKLNYGDIFKDKNSPNDDRIYKCVNEKTVQLLKPSSYQIKMDESFRGREWKNRSINHVEHNWYNQRGFYVEKGVER